MTHPNELPIRRTRRGVRLAARLALLAATALAAASPPDARGSAPVSPPVFSDPLTIDNPFFPCVPGALKVATGKSDGVRTVDLDLFTSETRDFLVDGKQVSCRGLQEVAFEGGDLVEISKNWFAQADDGTVWYEAGARLGIAANAGCR